MKLKEGRVKKIMKLKKKTEKTIAIYSAGALLFDLNKPLSFGP